MQISAVDNKNFDPGSSLKEAKEQMLSKYKVRNSAYITHIGAKYHQVQENYRKRQDWSQRLDKV